MAKKTIYKYTWTPLCWDAVDEDKEETFFDTKSELFAHVREELLEGMEAHDVDEVMKEFKRQGFYRDEQAENDYTWQKCKKKVS